MKSSVYQRRFYRRWQGARDLYKARVVIQETDLYILTDRPVDRDFVGKRLMRYRGQIERYIQKDRRFLASLKPITLDSDGPAIIRQMGEAAKKAGVGPMAAVAGAIAGFLGRDLLRKGYTEVIIENGGDIFLKSSKTRLVGIYAGASPLSRRLSLKIRPEDTPLGVCASSGTVGHTLSFGRADRAVVISKNASLADAAATATCNRVEAKEDMQKALDFARSVKGITGAVVVMGEALAAWGAVELA